MRHAPWFVLALVALWPDAAHAQQVRRFKVTASDVQVGFPTVSATSDVYGFKAGIWTPVLVRLTAAEDGNVNLPVEVDGSISGEMLIECADSDGVGNYYPQKFRLGPSDPLVVIGYTKASSSAPEIKISFNINGRKVVVANTTWPAIDVGGHLYLSLGDNLVDLYKGLVRLNNPFGQKNANAGQETRPRYAAYETDARNLPTNWFGYSAVDLAIMTTSNDKFLDRLIGDRQSSPQLAALATWVRQGGRLVVSVAPANREKVVRLLASPAWQPALPPVFTAESKTFTLGSLDGLRNWSNALNEPILNAKGENPQVPGVRLQQLPTVAVEAWTQEGNERVPLMVRFPHGMGSITLIGFDVKDPFMGEWKGNPLFWQEVIRKLAPSSNFAGAGQDMGNPGWNNSGSDITSSLYQELERFDTPTISFGWVVLFIFFYILVVGPVDYLVLKYVFKRLELTWITFPAVVITISLLAYFTAYAIKGQDLKVNKIDLLTIDMRSGLKDDFAPASARVYGTTWFSILSPRIQNYTIGIEPNMETWQGLEAPVQPVAPVMSWLGRPEQWGMGASGRGRSASLFSRTYEYQANAVGLRDVPIPVWTTKSFTASWESVLQKLPFESKLSYESGPGNNPNSLKGTIKSNLPFDLTEVGIIYRGKYCPLPDLPKGVAVEVVLDPLNLKDIAGWISAAENQLQQKVQQQQFQRNANMGGGTFEPSAVVRFLMFHEKANARGSLRNHNHRNLDLSWRVKEDAGDGAVREAILLGRVKRAAGPIQQIHDDAAEPLATRLWLGELPGTPIEGQTRTVTRADGKQEVVPALRPRPATLGTMVQDTYLRVLLPVGPAR